MVWFRAVQYGTLTFWYQIDMRPTLDIPEATDILQSEMTAASDTYTYEWPLLRGHDRKLKVGS
jgi:hypothetical protein